MQVSVYSDLVAWTVFEKLFPFQMEEFYYSVCKNTTL